MCPATNFEAFYNVFRDISRSVHSGTQLSEVLDLVVKNSTEVLGGKGAIVRILNLDTHHLELGAAYGLSEQYIYKGPVYSEQIIADLCQQNKVVLIDDIFGSSHVLYPKEAWEEGIRAILDVPLHLRESVVGIIRVYFSQKREFSEEELEFITSIAEQCAFAIDKARLIENQISQYLNLAVQTEKLSAMGRMAAGIAHEINNPLATILIYSTNLKKKLTDHDLLKEGLQVITHETIRCKSIIQELLEFSRERQPQKIQANINEVIEKALAILENEFRLHHASLDKHLAIDVPDIPLDGNQMQQVFVNLLMNSFESMQGQGKINIRSYVEPSQKFVKVEVSDNGCGIPNEHIDKVFEPFFSTKEKGTGLGLAVSYAIVKNHQGQIKVSSEPGKGSRFDIEIPILSEFPFLSKGHPGYDAH